jgi:hypothetical protein
MATVTVAKGQNDLNTYTYALGDTVFFGEGEQFVNNNTGPLANINVLALNRIYVDPRFTGQIGGGTAQSLSVGVNNGTLPIVIYAAGGGSMYIDANLNNAAGTVTRIKNINQGSLYLTGGGTFTSVETKGKLTQISSSTFVTNFRISAGEARLGAPPAGTQNNALAKFWADGGVVNCERFLDSDASNCEAYISGGAQVTVAASNTTTSLTTTNLPQASGTGHKVIVTGGALYWRGGGITELIVMGDGMVDLSSVPFSISIPTIRMTEKAMKRSRLKSKFGATITLGATVTEILSGDTDDILA